MMQEDSSWLTTAQFCHKELMQLCLSLQGKELLWNVVTYPIALEAEEFYGTLFAEKLGWGPLDIAGLPNDGERVPHEG